MIKYDIRDSDAFLDYKGEGEAFAAIKDSGVIALQYLPTFKPSFESLPKWVLLSLEVHPQIANPITTADNVPWKLEKKIIEAATDKGGYRQKDTPIELTDFKKMFSEIKSILEKETEKQRKAFYRNEKRSFRELKLGGKILLGMCSDFFFIPNDQDEL